MKFKIELDLDQMLNGDTREACLDASLKIVRKAAMAMLKDRAQISRWLTEPATSADSEPTTVGLITVDHKREYED